MVYRQDNRKKRHVGRYTILGIMLGIGLTIFGIHIYDNYKQSILDNVNQIKDKLVSEAIPASHIVIQQPVATTNNDQSGVQQPVQPIAVTIATELHIMINLQRTSNGLPALTWDDKLATIALGHSNYMVQTDDFGHTGLEQRLQEMGCIMGSENAEFVSVQGHYITQIPNISINDWMNSPPHRANLLKSSFTSEGIGIAEGNGKYYITEDFC